MKKRQELLISVPRWQFRELYVTAMNKKLECIKRNRGTSFEFFTGPDLGNCQKMYRILESIDFDPVPLSVDDAYALSFWSNPAPHDIPPWQ